ncbi:protein sorting system archaetidylserine synthase [Salinigranum marinum]|uniref:protein sorting system archaetidylserine synthase n=1 Tax=Salinigranum marinum TaxID=1515595 RepID=UPI002989D097|nr:protein sorting system archaetidylserine synthase [Salinigranum marinum]
MKPRFVGRLGLADAVTVSNAGLGFVAAVAATVDVGLAARVILLAAITDALDGVVARKVGSTPAGPYLDSLADVASFGVAPALLVACVVKAEWPLVAGAAVDPGPLVAGVGLPAAFVAMAVIRLGLYTAYDTDVSETQGVQTTLAATVLAATVLAGFDDPVVLVPLTLVLAVLMVTTITYPDLHAQDALVMGLVQFAAVVSRGWYGRGFAYALLFLALGYLLLAPVLYWRDGL